MADYTQTKNYGTAAYPVHCNEASGLVKRSEPLLTPELLKSRYLKGIPLSFPNGDSYSDDELKDKIMLAVNEAELLLNMTINKESFKEKQPYDANLYRAFIHMKTEHGPLLSVEHIAIVTADGTNAFELPPSWIEAANFAKRIINVIPLLAGYSGMNVSGSVTNSGLALLSLMGNSQFIPAFWQITYTAGMSNKEGQVPVAVNELIGVIAAISVLSAIAPNFIYNSQSLSADGLAQSSSGPGARIYELRISELSEKRDTIIKKLKGIFAGKFFVSSI